MKLEVWKDIENYPNYQVSNFGRVKSKERISSCCYNSTRKIKEKILKQNLEKNGYKTVCLFDNGKHTKRVHKLVAQSFIKNENNYPCINHIDGNKQNNNVGNLEWCSYSHNINEAYKLGLAKPSDNQKRKVREYCLKNKSKALYQLDTNNKIIKEWKSAVEVENTIGISRKNISQCIVGNNKTAGGYKWILKEQFEQIEYKVGE